MYKAKMLNSYVITVAGGRNNQISQPSICVRRFCYRHWFGDFAIDTAVEIKFIQLLTWFYNELS